ncbi:dockerin type I domain-containing protein [Halococcoides cellulosivorans]|uniref:EF-hand domain-containing protein n=1 Tax=Halococcoides cellulosivorans TaxID=1679096 RepID=A0A2R4X2X3_9EURY|nr:dockerin type I domain-containing protein [Halococcoides cellulosivorans]AWB28147.1 hypothetical protein HARCEL1_10740 [Halococcoides cellulosivorans]
MPDRSQSPEEDQVCTRRSALKAGLATTLGGVVVGSHVASGAESTAATDDETPTSRTTSTRVITGHTPPEIEPTIQVDDGPIQETTSVTVAPGTPVTLALHVTSGSVYDWFWDDGSTGRERTVRPTETTGYVAEYSAPPYFSGSVRFDVFVEGDPTPTPTDPTTTPTPESGPTWPADPGATDPDGDGLYEDLNGNGRIDFPDVNALFQHTGTEAVAANSQYYDVDSDGSVDLQDVLALFEDV